MITRKEANENEKRFYDVIISIVDDCFVTRMSISSR